VRPRDDDPQHVRDEGRAEAAEKTARGDYITDDLDWLVIELPEIGNVAESAAQRWQAEQAAYDALPPRTTLQPPGSLADP
jgi:hypothetical protein